MNNNKKGFTLIEILIVVAIISILAGIVLIGLRPGLGSARDARRQAELKQIQTALQIYYNRFGSYPSALIDLINEGVARTIPDDPSGAAYGYSTTGADYMLGTMFETPRSNSIKDHVNVGSAGAVTCTELNAYCITF